MTDVPAQNGLSEKTAFEKQRDGLVSQITQVSKCGKPISLISLEHGANYHEYESS